MKKSLNIKTKSQLLIFWLFFFVASAFLSLQYFRGAYVWLSSAIPLFILKWGFAFLAGLCLWRASGVYTKSKDNQFGIFIAAAFVLFVIATFIFFRFFFNLSG